MSEYLRPMTVGEVFDRSVQLFRTNFRLFIGVAAAPVAVSVAAISMMGDIALYSSGKHAFSIFSHLSKGERFLLLYLVLLPALFVANSISHSVLTRVASAVHLGEPIRVCFALRQTMRRFWCYLRLLGLQYLFLGLLLGVFGLAGFSLTVVGWSVE